MPAPRMRPRFEVVVPCTASQALQRIQTQLDAPDCPCIGSRLGRHVHLQVRASRQPFWAPHLHVDVEGHAEGTLVRGLVGPHPSVWTLFVALYAVLGFIGVVGGIAGLSQWSLGLPPVALWTVPLAGILAGAVYTIALIGQRMAYEQTATLRAFLDQAIR